MKRTASFWKKPSDFGYLLFSTPWVCSCVKHLVVKVTSRLAHSCASRHTTFDVRDMIDVGPATMPTSAVVDNNSQTTAKYKILAWVMSALLDLTMTWMQKWPIIEMEETSWVLWKRSHGVLSILIVYSDCDSRTRSNLCQVCLYQHERCLRALLPFGHVGWMALRHFIHAKTSNPTSIPWLLYWKESKVEEQEASIKSFSSFPSISSRGLNETFGFTIKLWAMRKWVLHEASRMIFVTAHSEKIDIALALYSFLMREPTLENQ